MHTINKLHLANSSGCLYLLILPLFITLAQYLVLVSYNSVRFHCYYSVAASVYCSPVNHLLCGRLTQGRALAKEEEGEEEKEEGLQKEHYNVRARAIYSEYNSSSIIMCSKRINNRRFRVIILL